MTETSLKPSSRSARLLDAERPYFTSGKELDEDVALNYVSGLRSEDFPPEIIERRRMLTPLQERRVTSRLLDDLKIDPGLSELASLCGLSPSYFSRVFRQTTGLPPHQWLLMQRVRQAKALLSGTKLSVAEIALECGFTDQSHMTRFFKKIIGISPGAWRRQQEA